MTPSPAAADADRATWAPEREITVVRVFDATRQEVFAAWTDADGFGDWFGPAGYTCSVHEMDVRVGGRSRFDLVAPDGTLFPNRIDYLEIVPDERIVMDHGTDVDDDPNRFRVMVCFDDQADGKSVLTLRQLHPSADRRKEAIGFGAVELGLQTLDKLARHITTRR